MKKVVYTKIGGPNSIEIHDFEPVELKHDEVRVRIFRAGINFADLMMRQGLYGSNPDFPFTPGYEVSGEIIELGEGVERLEVGQRVIVMTGFGGYSEQVVASTNRVIPIPDSISYDAAATLGVTYGTAYHMLVHLGNMRKGESVLIHHAAGGVGTAAVQICQALGVTNIIGTASSSKREFVESLGMRFVDRDAEDFVMVCKDMTNGKGVHHAIDPVGGKHLMRSYKALRNGGKLYCFGASAAVTGPKRNYFSAFKMWRSTPKFNPLIMMNSNKAIFGVHMGRMDESTVFESHMMDLAKMLQQGKIDPIIDSVWRFE
ncbi:MAG: zinc-binding dehydrogenase, partial [Euryarchaeota archaeon]|nr:zinc-binding dehydrogenase [Euryarchaeota archaeon]MBT7433396.1 zinc-binding dehydrogenase [Euryarchaeota archaeon]